MTLILILTTWSLFALMEPVYCSPKANTAEFTRLLACHGALSCSRFVNTSNCFTRWVGILSRTSLGESTWLIHPMLRQTDNIWRSILNHSYSLKEIWEPREVLHAPLFPLAHQVVHKGCNTLAMLVIFAMPSTTIGLFFVVLFADETSRKHVSLLVES